MMESMTTIISGRMGHGASPRLEGNALALFGLDALFLPDHVPNFLVELFGGDAGTHAGVSASRMDPDPVPGIPTVSFFLQAIDDFLARFLLRASIAKLDGNQAIFVAVEEPDTGEIVGGNAERIRRSRTLLFFDAIGEAGLRRCSEVGGSATAVAASAAGDSFVAVGVSVDVDVSDVRLRDMVVLLVRCDESNH